MIAALYEQTKSCSMKKLLLMAVLGCFTYFGTVAQGNSAYGHSHKKAKHPKKHYALSNSTAAQRKAYNVQHKTAVKTIRSNDALTNQQQKDQVKQANATHRIEMKAVTKNTGRKK